MFVPSCWCHLYSFGGQIWVCLSGPNKQMMHIDLLNGGFSTGKINYHLQNPCKSAFDLHPIRPRQTHPRVSEDQSQKGWASHVPMFQQTSTNHDEPLFRDPSKSSRIFWALTFNPPVILVATTILSLLVLSLATHLPMISSVKPSGFKASDGMGYCSAVSTWAFAGCKDSDPIKNPGETKWLNYLTNRARQNTKVSPKHGFQQGNLPLVIKAYHKHRHHRRTEFHVSIALNILQPSAISPATKLTAPSKMARSIIWWHKASSGALKSALPHPENRAWKGAWKLVFLYFLIFG